MQTNDPRMSWLDQRWRMVPAVRGLPDHTHSDRNNNNNNNNKFAGRITCRSELTLDRELGLFPHVLSSSVANGGTVTPVAASQTLMTVSKFVEGEHVEKVNRVGSTATTM